MPKAKQEVIDELLKDYIRVYDKTAKRAKWLHYATGEEFDPKKLELLAGSHAIAKKNENRYHFDFEAAKMMIELVRKGRTLEEIGETDGFPPIEILLYWRSIYPTFRGLLKDAERDRANHYHDQIVRIADEVNANAPDKDTLAAKKLAVDSYKWAAEKGDPDKYGKKSETKHTGEAATTIVVNTGIDRSAKTVELPEDQYEIVEDNSSNERIDI